MKRVLLVLLALFVVFGCTTPDGVMAGDKEFFCAATAYDTSDNESVYSNEVNTIVSENTDVTFSWENPTTNEDGSVYDDAAGTKMYCGPATAGYNQAWDIQDPNATTATVKINPTNRPGPPKNYQRVMHIVEQLDRMVAEHGQKRIMWSNDLMPM